MTPHRGLPPLRQTDFTVPTFPPLAPFVPSLYLGLIPGYLHHVQTRFKKCLPPLTPQKLLVTSFTHPFLNDSSYSMSLFSSLVLTATAKVLHLRSFLFRIETTASSTIEARFRRDTRAFCNNSYPNGCEFAKRRGAIPVPTIRLFSYFFPANRSSPSC